MQISMCIELRVYLLVYRRLRVRLIRRVHGPTRDLLSVRYTVSVYELIVSSIAYLARYRIDTVSAVIESHTD